MTTTTAPAPQLLVDGRPFAPVDHREAMVLAEHAYARLADLVEGLGPDDWARPTDCEGWTVRDLVGHLVGAMRSAASVRELLRQQREVKRRTKAEGGVETDHMTAIQIELAADLSPDELVRELRDLVPAATAGRRRTPRPLRTLVRVPVDMGTLAETWSLGYLVDRVLTRDAWLHRIDLCRALGREPTLDHDHDGRIVADVVADLAGRRPEPSSLVLTGPAGGTFTWGGPHGAASVEADAVEACRMLSGRAEPSHPLLAVPVPF